jgi:hypothetical protein
MAKKENKEREYLVSIKEYDDKKMAKIFMRISKELSNNYDMFSAGELIRANGWSIAYRTPRKREALDMFCFMHIFDKNLDLKCTLLTKRISNKCDRHSVLCEYNYKITSLRRR